jgi:hypothetical protein
MKFASCEIPLFGRHVLAAMHCSEEEALTHFAAFGRQHDACVNLTRVSTASGWAQVEHGDIYLWARDSCAVLFHEITHAAFKLCQLTDIACDEELICRLVEFMKLNIVDKLEDVA